MKEHGDMEKTERVKKFRYISPEKKTATIRSFSNESDSPTVSSYSFDPEKAWSIRKDVSVSLASPHSSSVFGYGVVSSPNTRYGSPKSNLYSRHAGYMKSTSDSMLETNRSGINLGQPKLTWQSGTNRNSQLGYSKRNGNIALSSNESHDLPTSSMQPSSKQSREHRNNLPTNVTSTSNVHKSYPSSNFEKKSHPERNYGNKYNSAFYNNF